VSETENDVDSPNTLAGAIPSKEKPAILVSTKTLLCKDNTFHYLNKHIQQTRDNASIIFHSIKWNTG